MPGCAAGAGRRADHRGTACAAGGVEAHQPVLGGPSAEVGECWWEVPAPDCLAPPPPRAHPAAARASPWALCRSEELILALVREVNTAAALDALPMVAASASLCRRAITALAQRNSLRGVRAMLQRAKDVRVAGGPEARGLWRAAIVAFGRLRRPAEARQAFVEMRALGAWEVSDTATVNLLLNALASDIRLQFIRCVLAWLGGCRWEGTRWPCSDCQPALPPAATLSVPPSLPLGRFNQLRQEGVAPDASSFNCLLKGCMRARDARRAGLALGWMAEAEVPPDEITWNTLIKVRVGVRVGGEAGSTGRSAACWDSAPRHGALCWHGASLPACSHANTPSHAPQPNPPPGLLLLRRL